MKILLWYFFVMFNLSKRRKQKFTCMLFILLYVSLCVYLLVLLFPVIQISVELSNFLVSPYTNRCSKKRRKGKIYKQNHVKSKSINTLSHCTFSLHHWDYNFWNFLKLKCRLSLKCRFFPSQNNHVFHIGFLKGFLKKIQDITLKIKNIFKIYSLWVSYISKLFF